MTDNVEVISRPKVRFSQFFDNVRNKKEVIKHRKEQVQANGPKIKKIVSLKKPIRVVDSIKSTSIRDKNVPLSDYNIDTLSQYVTTSDKIRNTPAFTDVTKDMTRCEGENTMILRDGDGIQRWNTENTEKSKISQLDDPRDNVFKDRAECLQQKGKENQGISLKRAVSSKNANETKTKNSHPVQSAEFKKEKLKLSTGDDHIRKVNVKPAFKEAKIIRSLSMPNMKKTSNLMIREKILNVKPVTTLSRVTSHFKTVPRNKISPVKKMALRNVSGLKIKTSVGPGVFHKEQTKTNNANEKYTVTSDITLEDLAQPEYNSILCTINKLKEFEQRKIVTNVNHLPSTLKNFLNGKISMALDFPLDEAIYKNLVNLNVDEKQLPSTVTRSKDPEPRQKDIVPKLFDFFTPEDTKEICEAVHVKSRALKIDDNWDAFKISDKILEWKYSIDDID